MSKLLRNGIKHIVFDGCMFPNGIMYDPQTWIDILNLADRIVAHLLELGLPPADIPKIHMGIWARFVGRGSGSELGEVIALDQALRWVEGAQSASGRIFDGIDLIEGADVSFDMPESEFKSFVRRLQASALSVGDIVANTWPGEGQGGAFDSEEDRQRMVQAVERACKLWMRFKDAGVAKYGAIRVDSGKGPEAFNTETIRNHSLLVGTFQALADLAARYNLNVVMEGEVCWGGMAGHRQCNSVLHDVNRPNFLFQADTAHLLHFLAGVNVDPSDSLLPEGVVVYDPNDPEIDFEVPDGVRPATPEELWEGWQKLAGILGPKIGSIHFATSRGTLFGSGDHAKTGRHCPPNDPKNVVDVPKVVGLLALQKI